MPLLSHVDRIAATRTTYVYAFRRLAKLHDISTGRPQDFFGLPDTLQANHGFRADLFRIAESALSNSPELSVQDVVIIIALAFGGNEIAAHTELDVPDSLLQLFTAVLSSGEPAPPEPPPRVSPPVSPPETSTPPAPVKQQPIPLPPRPATAPRPPILQQALLADVPDPAPTLPDADVQHDIQRLQSERLALKRRLRKMERRLHLVASKLDSLQPASPPATPPHPAPAEPPPEPRLPRQSDQSTRSDGMPRLVTRADVYAAARAPELQNSAVEPYQSSIVTRLVDRIGPLRSRTGLALLCALPLVVVALILLAHSIHRQPPNATPTHAASETAANDSDDWVAPSTAEPADGHTATPNPPRRAEAEADITRTLGAWAEAFANNDPDAEASFYAPALDRYFLQRNVSHQFVLHDKQAYRARGNRIQSYTVSGLEFQFQSPDSAVVTFTKSWSVLGPQQTGYPHSTRSRVWLTRLPEGWRITGEQDLRQSE